MKNILIIFHLRLLSSLKLVLAFTLFSLNKVNATNYYFSSSAGNDLNSTTQAQNLLTPWKTLEKLSSFFDHLQPGDSVLFKSGDIFYGSINITKSGIPKNPIVFGAYGKGAKPQISGLTKLNRWTDLGNGIWESSPCLECGININVLLLNGVFTPMGRYPNADVNNNGYLTYEAHLGSTSITDTDLRSTPNWTGAELIVRKNRWMTDKGEIINHSNHAITYTAQTDYEASNGFGYFIQNSIKTLNKKGEWYYNTRTKRVDVYFDSSIALTDIQVSAVSSLLSIHYQSNIVFSNLSFKGSNLTAIDIRNSQNIQINSCEVNFSGIDGIYGYELDSFTVENSAITASNNNAIFLTNRCNASSIVNNTIRNTGLNVSMGNPSNGSSFCGIIISGAGVYACNNTVVKNNVIDSTGYNGIVFSGNNITILNNVITTFCLVNDDGGGIYTYRGNANNFIYSNRNIIGNIVLNGKRADAGTAEPIQAATWGIYIDDNAQNVTISDNTVAEMPGSGIFLHNAYNIELKKNTLYNNSIEQLKLSHDFTGPALKNVVIKHNILFSKYPNQLCLRNTTIGNNIDNFGIADSNYYCRPLDEENVIYTEDNEGFNAFSLAKWKQVHHKDNHSQKTVKPIVAYIVNNYAGAKVYNDSFDNNINGCNCWNPSLSCIVNWHTDKQTGNGALKITYNKKTVETTDVIVDVGHISANKNYILSFTTLGTKRRSVLGTYLRQTNSPYKSLSIKKYALLTKKTMNNEFLLVSSTTEKLASIVFEANSTDSTFWLDNIKLNEANVTVTNPDDSIRFEYNTTRKNMTVVLQEKYIGMDSTIFTNKVVLKPYTSLILLKAGEQQAPALQYVHYKFQQASAPANVVLK